jgi:hypothetical protein
MKILAIEHDAPGATADQFQPHLEAEAAQVYALYQDGVIREFHFRQDQPAAVLVLECPTLEAAQQALSTLPFVQVGLIAFELIPLVPYPGLSRLFRA